MDHLKDLTNFLCYLHTLHKPHVPDFPHFALAASSKSANLHLINSILGFNLIPADFSHKLQYLEISLKTITNSTEPNDCIYELSNIPEKFTSIDTFQAQLCQYINSLPQNYSETVSIQVSSVFFPTITFIVLPEFTKDGSLTTEDLESELESAKKKILKKIIRNPTNLVLYALTQDHDLETCKLMEYLRRYDPYGLRSLLVFTGFEGNDLFEEQKKKEIEEFLMEGEFPLRHGVIFINSNDSSEEGSSPLQDNNDSIVVVKNTETEEEKKDVTDGRESLLLKLKELVQYSMRDVFPGLLDELHWIVKDLQAQLDLLNEETARLAAGVGDDNTKAALDLGARVWKEVQETILTKEKGNNAGSRISLENQANLSKIERRPRIHSVNSVGYAANLPPIKKSLFADTNGYVGSMGSLENGDSPKSANINQELEISSCHAHIMKLLGSLYKGEAYRDDIMGFKIISTEELEKVAQTSQSLTVKDAFNSEGFKSLIVSKLQWMVNSTYEGIWNIHETVLKTVLSTVDKHFVRLPALKEILKQELRGLLQETRESTVQILGPFVNAQVSYIYCCDPGKTFGDLYEIQNKFKPKKANFNQEPSLGTLAKELSEVCRIYCETTVLSLRDSVPRVIGQVYLGNLTHNLQNKVKNCIESLAEKDPEAMKLTDPYQDQKEDIKNKLQIAEKAKEYLFQEETIRGVLWLETIDVMPEADKSMRTMRMVSESDTCVTCDDSEEGKRNCEHRKRDHEGNFEEAKRLRSERSQREGFSQKNEKSFCSMGEEFSVIGDEEDMLKEVVENLDTNFLGSNTQNEDQKSDRVLTPFKSTSSIMENPIQESPQKEINPNRSLINIQDINLLSINIRQRSASNVVALEGLEVIPDYYTRSQKIQSQVLTQRDWFTAIGEESLCHVNDTRLLASLQYGVPKEIRGSIWMLLAKAKDMKSKHPKGFYDELCERGSTWNYMIEKDLARTLVEEPFFRDSEYQGGEKLGRILKAYANYDPELGYTQGMNAIAGIVLMVMCGYSSNTKASKYKRLPKSCERNSFWVFVHIMREKKYRDSFVDSYPRLMENVRRFEKVLEQKYSDVYNHMGRWGISVESAFMHQFMTIGGQNSPLELFMRMMDVFLVRGEAVVVDILLKSLEICKEEIMTAKDDKLFRLLKHELLHIAFNKCQKDINKLLVSEA